MASENDAMSHYPVYESEFTMYSDISRSPRYCPPHAHECFEVLYVLEGRCKIEADGGQWVAKPHDLIIFKPYQRHEETQLTDVYALVCMRFPGEFIAEHHVPLR